MWQILSDIENWPNWNKHITETHLLGALSEGTVFSWKNNGSKIHSKINTLETNQKFGWTGLAFGSNKAIHNWTLIPFDNGTKVITNESIEG